MPRSSSGSDERVFTPRWILSLELDRLGVGKGDCALELIAVEGAVCEGKGSGIGLSSSSFGGGNPKSRSLSALSIADPCVLASAVTLLAEREGLRPRMGAGPAGAVKFRAGTGGPCVELRTEERNGARSERTCMLVGRRRLRALACACCAAVCCKADAAGGGLEPVMGGGEIGVGNSERRCDGDFCRPFPVIVACATEARLSGSTVAVSACTTGVSPGGSGSCTEDLLRLRVDVGAAFGVEGLILSGMLKVDIRFGLAVSEAGLACTGEPVDGVCVWVGVF